jgi:hypothetical protein
MKQPRHSIRSTCHHPAPMAQPTPPVLPLFDAIPVYPGPAYSVQPGPNVIIDDGDKSIAYIFCFGAFVDRNRGIVYHNLTGLFPFMSFDGSVCLFVLYHHESNAILAMPIAGLDNRSIFTACKTCFKKLIAKEFKQKLNIMDNRATKHVKKYLTKNKCKLQSWSCMITVSMPSNVRSRHLKLHSLQHLLLLTVISHCNCGIDLPRTSSTP